jgi:hypothetical protein
MKGGIDSLTGGKGEIAAESTAAGNFGMDGGAIAGRAWSEECST